MPNVLRIEIHGMQKRQEASLISVCPQYLISNEGPGTKRAFSKQMHGLLCHYVQNTFTAGMFSGRSILGIIHIEVEMMLEIDSLNSLLLEIPPGKSL